MSIWSTRHEHEARDNANKIAEVITNSDDRELNKQLAPILERYAQESGGLYSSKDLSRVLKKFNEDNWTYQNTSLDNKSGEFFYQPLRIFYTKNLYSNFDHYLGGHPEGVNEGVKILGMML